jgi:hypothetical protein
VEGTHCGAYRDRIVEAATGPVPPEVWEDLRGHLSGCSRCRAEWEALREVVAWLRGIPEPPIPAGFWEELNRHQASLPGELPVGPRIAAKPYARKFSAAFRSRSSVSPHAAQE